MKRQRIRGRTRQTAGGRGRRCRRFAARQNRGVLRDRLMTQTAQELQCGIKVCGGKSKAEVRMIAGRDPCGARIRVPVWPGRRHPLQLHAANITERNGPAEPGKPGCGIPVFPAPNCKVSAQGSRAQISATWLGVCRARGTSGSLPPRMIVPSMPANSRRVRAPQPIATSGSVGV